MESADYDDNISSSLTYRHFIQIKRVKKLCNNSTAPKKGEEGYNPTYNYDYIFKTIIYNNNLLSKRGELDSTGDRTSWTTASFGKAGDVKPALDSVLALSMLHCVDYILS